MRKKIVAGNWKMHKSYKEGIELLDETLVLLDMEKVKGVEVVFCPPFIHLHKASKSIEGSKYIHTGAQNCHWEESGAYTGETSCGMIKSAGASYVIVGHSERRQYFNETNEQLGKKVNVALKHKLTPIYCCGETLNIREANEHFEVVGSQIKESLFHLSKEEMEQVVIAYEPVWAIGTGKNASKEQAQEMHAFIRKTIAHQYTLGVAENISILYGGSCKPSNAPELFSQPDVDGGLIGGASLAAADFVGIIKSF
jgi:triosephosphate isomerase